MTRRRPLHPDANESPEVRLHRWSPGRDGDRHAHGGHRVGEVACGAVAPAKAEAEAPVRGSAADGDRAEGDLHRHDADLVRRDRVELDPARPQTVNSFVFLAEAGYFDGQYFHRLDTSIDVIQGGDPSGDGTGGPGYAIPDELTGDESYTPGTLAMANAGANSGGSQFFLITGPAGTNLDGNPAFTIFGKVVEGLDVAHRIEASDRGPRFRRHLRAAARGGRLHRVGDDRSPAAAEGPSGRGFRQPRVDPARISALTSSSAKDARTPVRAISARSTSSKLQVSRALR